MILVDEGQSPIILCLPHSGTDVPNAVSGRLNATGRLQADLAWRLERVFGFHADLDLTVLRSSVSRYVIDPDVDPALQPGADADKPALCPETTLDGKRIYQDGEEPGPTEIEQRVLLFHTPFHNELRKQIDRLMRRHRHIVLLDCQSMRSQIKGVTDKGLSVFNIGSAGGLSCDADLRNLFVGSFSGLEGLTVGVDEQTTGGYIVQSYGKPDHGIHSLTLLLAQRSYLRHESPPFEPDRTRVSRLQSVLADSFSRIIDWLGSQDRAHAATANESAPAPPEDVEYTTEADIPPARGDGDEPADESGSRSDEGETQASLDQKEIIPVDPMTLTQQAAPGDDPQSLQRQMPLLVAE
ncbi:N-formylglutamate amidohydrolase [Roseibium sp. HPY-6]|uniref:N-formylglutamate amidohydrolase n=1 Tax=Roseibium sp. HPY-6 TaxID=3229852 RepID=UPI00339059BC